MSMETIIVEIKEAADKLDEVKFEINLDAVVESIKTAAVVVVIALFWLTLG